MTLFFVKSGGKFGLVWTFAVPQPALQRFNILSSGLWWDLIQGSGLN